MNIVFFVYSEEEFALCPICSTFLKYHSWIKRGLKDISGEKSTYKIRVLKCENEACTQTYHRELPDIIVPYKRYDAESIEKVIDHDGSDVLTATDNSTIQRWRAWFKSNMISMMMALTSVMVEIENDSETSSLVKQKQTSNNPLETIKKIVARREKWLNETVRVLVNSARWTFNRSVFMSR
jgi:hypothetical protein